MVFKSFMEIMMANRAVFKRVSRTVNEKLGEQVAKGTHQADIVGGRPILRILDLGASAGEPSLTISKEVGTGRDFGIEILSTDLLPINVEAGRSRALHYGTKNVTFETLDAMDLSSLPENRFNAVTASFLWMFLPDLDKAFAEVKRVLKPGGIIVGNIMGPQSSMVIGRSLFRMPDVLAEEGLLPPPDFKSPFCLGTEIPNGKLDGAMINNGFINIVSAKESHVAGLPGTCVEDVIERFIRATPLGGHLDKHEASDEVRRRAVEVCVELLAKEGFAYIRQN
mmetsp:Transcript_7483/g.10536  ORF Transcript_7483/g.10536 Transcript_7483/m.10536 type:complete len:281 (+) Transcript_7483:157-999(+)